LLLSASRGAFDRSVIRLDLIGLLCQSQQRINHRFANLEIQSSLARFWRDQDKRNEARDLLAPIYNWFTEGFDTPVLPDAKALLDQRA
jgi:hypothetical protein